MRDVLRDNPIPTILVIIAAIVGALILAVAAIRGEPDASGLTFETYFQTLIAGAVGLGAVRAVAQGLAARNGGDGDKKV